MNDSNYIISPQKAPSTPPRPSHIEHTAATWICWAAAHYCSSCRRQRSSGEASRSSCTTPASAPSSTTCCAGRMLHSRTYGSGSECAPGRHRVLAGQLPASPLRHHAPRSKTTASPRTLGNFARPTGTGAATPLPHSSDTTVLKKESLVFMSQPNDGSMPPRTAGGNLGLTCSPTRSHPASLFFATQYIIRTRRR